MVTFMLFGLTSVMFGALGFVMSLFPYLAIRFIEKIVKDPWRRFWFAQMMFLFGLVLIAGTLSLQGVLLWIICGVIAVTVAAILLGSSDSFRARLTINITVFPLWAYRCVGVVNLVLLVLFVADVILYA